MSNNTWELIKREKIEVFKLTEHFDFNDLDMRLELSRFNIGRAITSTPYVKKTKGGNKHVEIGYFTKKQCFDTVVEKEQWLKDSFVLFNSASVSRNTIVLEKNEDKVKLSIFRFYKHRRVGHKFFKKENSAIHVTFNKKTKNFFITKSNFLNRRRSVVTNKNNFYSLGTLKSLIENNLTLFTGKKSISVIQEFLNTLSLELNVQPCFGNNIIELTLKWFVKVRGIKAPNNYAHYMINHYPTIRVLKKNKMNLIRSVMQNNNLEGKFYVKLLNLKDCNLTDLVVLENLLGSNYVKEINLDILARSNNFFDYKGRSKDELEILINANINLNTINKNEKRNIVKIFNSFDDNNGKLFDGSFLSVLLDHIRIKNKLMTYGIDKKIKAKDILVFNDEHYEWSELLTKCENNIITEYIYPKEFLEHIEKEIVLDGETYFVKVLKNNLDYVMEGTTQNHCVGTYVNSYKSIIISVRKNDIKGLERMTCEFLPNCKSSNNEPNLVQARMKFNNQPKDNWDVVKRLVRKEFLDYCCVKTNKIRPTISVTNSINNHVKKLIYDEETGQYVHEKSKDELVSCVVLNYGNDNLDLPF
jgi:hypothetical protein